MSTETAQQDPEQAPRAWDTPIWDELADRYAQITGETPALDPTE